MDEVKIPIGVGDYLLKQLFSTSSSSRRIDVSCGGHKLFKGITVTLTDSDADARVSRPVILQDIEHIGWILDDMHYELDSLIEDDR